MLGIGVNLRTLRSSVAASAISAYYAGGIKPELVFDFENEKYFTDSLSTTFDSAITHTRNSNATMVDSDGLLKWAPHNASPGWGSLTPNGGNGSITLMPNEVGPDGNTGSVYRVQLPAISATYVTFANNPFGGAKGTVGTWVKAYGAETRFSLFNRAASGADRNATSEWVKHTVEGGTGSINGFNNGNDSYAVDVLVWGAFIYRSDLGGMVDNPDRGDSYVPTTSAARYLPRRGHHVYNGAEWVNEGALFEPTGAVQLLHTTDALVTQSHTVTAVPHTLHFTGTGTVTLSGAYSGSLVGTGTGEENRVSLTFTPTAASLTLTVSGTVSDAQLEVGSVPTSYIPNLAGSGTVTRAADDADSDNLTYDSSAMWFTLSGLQTFADEGVAGQEVLFDWRADANNRITVTIDTDGAETGEITLTVVSGGTTWSVAQDYLSPGVNVPFSIAWRVTDTEINVAAGGTSATAVATTSIPDLSSASAAFDGNGVYSLFRQGIGDIGDSGIAETSA